MLNKYIYGWKAFFLEKHSKNAIEFRITNAEQITAANAKITISETPAGDSLDYGSYTQPVVALSATSMRNNSGIPGLSWSYRPGSQDLP